LVEFTKICYIPYAFWWKMDSFLCGFNMTFYRNLFLGFMESPEHAAQIQAQLPLRNRVVFCGYPVLDDVEFQEKQRTIRSILWTPRWTYADVLGGSHFFEYKDGFVNLGDELKNISLTLRPHPLAFDNFIAEGRMTTEDVKSFKTLLKQKDITLDASGMIADTFEATDVCVTDWSSIIVAFFLTGKPIILCDSPIYHDEPGHSSLSFWSSQMMECLYIADSWDDVLKYLKELAAGNDYLYEKRREVAYGLLRENAGASKRILDTLRKDYAGEMEHSVKE